MGKLMLTLVDKPLMLVSDLINSDNNIPPGTKTSMIARLDRAQIVFLAQLLACDEESLQGDRRASEGVFPSQRFKQTEYLKAALAKHGYELGQMQDHRVALRYRPKDIHSFRSILIKETEEEKATRERYGDAKALFPRAYYNEERNDVIAGIKAVYPTGYDFDCVAKPEVIEVQAITPETIEQILWRALKTPNTADAKQQNMSGLPGLSKEFMKAFLNKKPEILEIAARDLAKAINTELGHTHKTRKGQDLTPGQ